MEARAVSDKVPTSEPATEPVLLIVFVRVPATVSTTAFTIFPVPLMALTISPVTASTMLLCAMAHLHVNCVNCAYVQTITPIPPYTRIRRDITSAIFILHTTFILPAD